MSSADCRQRGPLSVRVRQHRLQLLRAWLIHFVSSLDYYIMECILESAHLRLDKALQEACHFGQVIQCHDMYIQSVYSQCLQQPSAAYLRDAINEVNCVVVDDFPSQVLRNNNRWSFCIIFKILNISSSVVKAWKNGIDSVELIDLEESYARHHLYVASVLATDAAHSTLPHGKHTLTVTVYNMGQQQNRIHPDDLFLHWVLDRRTTRETNNDSTAIKEDCIV